MIKLRFMEIVLEYIFWASMSNMPKAVSKKIQDKCSSLIFDIKEELEKNYWFDLSRSFPNERVYPNITRGFNAFGKSFFYKSVKLGSNKSVNEVVEIIMKDVELINSNLTAIKKIVAHAVQ